MHVPSEEWHEASVVDLHGSFQIVSVGRSSYQKECWCLRVSFGVCYSGASTCTVVQNFVLEGFRSNPTSRNFVQSHSNMEIDFGQFVAIQHQIVNISIYSHVREACSQKINEGLKIPCFFHSIPCFFHSKRAACNQRSTMKGSRYRLV